MAGEFAVHIGAGVYLDSEGIITFQVPPVAQVFQAPAGFNIDTKSLQDTFKDLSGILPSSEDDKKKWIEWGAPKDVVELLGSVAGVAGMLGTAVATYFWAVGVIIKLMSLISSDDQMSPQMQKAFDGLRNLAKGSEQIRLVEKVVKLLEPFKTKAASMQGKINVLNASGPTGPASFPIYEEMREILNELALAIGPLCDEPWLTLFDADDFKGRAFISIRLVTVEPGGVLKPVPFNPAPAMFNHRIGVPALLYGFTTYMALLRTAMPWFRSQGEFAPQLRRAASAVDLFVMNMQTLCLARTNHTGDTIMEEKIFKSPEIPGRDFDPQQGGLSRSSLYPPKYPVGAFDLANYSDEYLGQRFTDQFVAYGDIGRRGAFDYTWEPPADMADLDQVAALANAQAIKDYTELQAVSGVFHLLKLAGELRWLSTPPMTSEIVRGKGGSSRTRMGEVAAEAISPPIFPVGEIRAPARLRHYDARAHVAAVTQEPGFFGPKFYRILLRTVSCQSGAQGWHNREYVEDVWQPYYRKADGDPKNLQLDSLIHDENTAFLWQLEIAAGHPSTATFHAKDTVTLEASTFDWYVPILSAHSPFVELEIEAKHFPPIGGAKKLSRQEQIATSGGLSLHGWSKNPATPARGGFALTTIHSDTVDVNPGMFAMTDISLERAERRHVHRETVTLSWEITWTGSDVRVELKGDPTQRPFQVFVVIEERAYSGAAVGPNTVQLHMPFKLEIVNQAMLVPEDFFKEEAAALARGEKLYNDLNSKYAKSRPAGPGDPIVGMLDRVREELVRSPSTSTIAEGLNTRLDFMREAMPDEFRKLMGRTNTNWTRS